MIGEPIPDPRHQILADLNARIEQFFAEGGEVTELSPPKYEPRPVAEPTQHDKIRALAKTMTLAQAVKATGMDRSQLFRMARESGFHFQSDNKERKARDLARQARKEAEARRCEQIKVLCAEGMTRSQAARQMSISQGHLTRLIKDYSINFPPRGAKP